jgi:thiamine-monophosphate kinase
MRSGGEFDLIAKLAARAREAGAAHSRNLVLGIGDDAAVTVAPGASATSVDMLVEGVHFRRDRASLRDIGRKSLSAALSDLAAMGAEPGEAYVALAMPSDLDEAGCLELIAGLAEVAAETGTALAGGDISAAPRLAIAITVVGYAAAAERLVARAGARPGQALAVTGELGGAAAGLLILERPELREPLEPAVAERLARRQLDPTPRLAAGAGLAGAGAAAMIDVSDGLGADAEQIAAASDAGARIELDRLPIQGGVAKVAATAGLDPLELAASGGEDYELLVALAPEQVHEATAAVARAGTALAVIGEVIRGAGVELCDRDGDIRRPSGFDHLRAGRARGARARPR